MLPAGTVLQCNDTIANMHGMHIAGMDLNLIVVLHALLSERSVSRAAKRIGLSQSATSHALARLRGLLKDPLFVRAGVGSCRRHAPRRWQRRSRPRSRRCKRRCLPRRRSIPGPRSAPFHVGASDYAGARRHARVTRAPRQGRTRRGPRVRPQIADPMDALAHGALDLVIDPTRTSDRAEGFYKGGALAGSFRRGGPARPSSRCAAR